MMQPNVYGVHSKTCTYLVWVGTSWHHLTNAHTLMTILCTLYSRPVVTQLAIMMTRMMPASSSQGYESRLRLPPYNAVASITIVLVHPQELSAATNALFMLTASLLQVQQEERAEQQRLAQQEREQVLQQQRLTQQEREQLKQLQQQQQQQQMLMQAGPAMRTNVVQTAR